LLSAELRTFDRELAEMKADAHRDSAASIAALEQVRRSIDSRVQAIEERQLTLEHLLLSAQVTQRFIAGPSLVTSPSLRSDVDRVLDATGFGRLSADFDRNRLQSESEGVRQLLEAVQRRVTALATQEQRRHQAHLEEIERARQRTAEEAARREELARQRAERIAQVLSLMLGLLGLSGVFALMQSGYGLTDEPDYIWTSLFVLFLAPLVILALYTAGRLIVTTVIRHRATDGRRPADSERGVET
jgi:hypothetical protein